MFHKPHVALQQFCKDFPLIQYLKPLPRSNYDPNGPAMLLHDALCTRLQRHCCSDLDTVHHKAGLAVLHARVLEQRIHDEATVVLHIGHNDA